MAALRDANGYSQKELAKLTGKPESEISRLLSLLKLNPAVQHAARNDETGALTRRHLAALAQMPDESQPQFMEKVQQSHLTAQETERMVQEAKAKKDGKKTRGSPIGQRLRYATSKATVTMHFRRRNVTVDDILAVLAEVRDQAMNSKATTAPST